jgi:DNA topoisomerase-2
MSKTTKKQGSQYVNDCRRSYALYVMQQRAIPSAADGLKSGARRVLWIARDGHKYKSATLAGAAMPLHPHDAPEGAIDTLAAPYGNNIPLFRKHGSFGTLLAPKAYGASRYTSVEVSKFTKDVVFRDIEVVPMQKNYDGTVDEPTHFLPLVPVSMINPAEGIALGYATSILPRALDDIILAQIAHLKGAKRISSPLPKFMPLQQAGIPVKDNVYVFSGSVVIKNTTEAKVTSLPYGLSHAKFLESLDALLEGDTLVDYVDNSRNTINIDVKFRRGFLKDYTEETLIQMLKLTCRHTENLNLVDFSGDSIMSTNPVDLIRQFTDWRLGWYVQRYERLRDLIKLDLQRYYDIRTAIKHKISATAGKTQSRSELKELLAGIGIVHIDYIADLPIYRFTEEERLKNEQRIKDAEAELQTYLDLLSSEDKRKKVYISELQEILGNYTKNIYATL